MHHADRNAHSQLRATADNDKARLQADTVAAQAVLEAREALRIRRGILATLRRLFA